MHRPEYIKLINEAASVLGIEVVHFSENWAIKLTKNGTTKYIVGNTFPLNDSTCFKIAGNKNLCSEILTATNIPNVPHQLVISPSILVKRKSKNGNLNAIHKFILENGFPLLIKKNNSSRGDGVYLVFNEPDMENILSKVYTTDSTLCLSPFRDNFREFRCIILDGECLLSYEKLIPYVVGNGKSTIVELFSDFLKNNANARNSDNLIDSSLLMKLNVIPNMDEKVFLQWKHNRSFGTKFELIDNPEMNQLAIIAAKAINARFVSVDIIHTNKFGLEVLEINASVSIHYPLFSDTQFVKYKNEIEIYQLALSKIFN